jgi:hypothetical protein
LLRLGGQRDRAGRQSFVEQSFERTVHDHVRDGAFPNLERDEQDGLWLGRCCRNCQTGNSARGCACLQGLLLDSHNFAKSSDCRDTHLRGADLRYRHARTNRAYVGYSGHAIAHLDE